MSEPRLSQGKWIALKLKEAVSTIDVYRMYEQCKRETGTKATYESFKRTVRYMAKREEQPPMPVNMEMEGLREEVKRLQRVIRDITKDTVLEDRLIASLDSVVQKYKPLDKRITHKSTSNKNREAVLMLSDWHLDEKVNKDEVFNINEFNWDIAEARIDYLFDKAIQNALELRCETLNIFLLGDFFSGIIKEDLLYGAEIGLTPTIIRAFDIMAQHIQQAAKNFDIRIACTFGNHSRVTPMKGFNKAYTLNLEWMLYEFLRRETEDVVDTFANPKSPIYIIGIQGYNFMIMHGDMISGGNNLAKIPAITFSRDAAKINGTLATKHYSDMKHGNQSEIPARVDYILAAHFHNEFTIPGFDDIPIFGNGCLVGGNSFSLKAMKSASRPSQRFFVVENGTGVRFMDTIYLDYL